MPFATCVRAGKDHLGGIGNVTTFHKLTVFSRILELVLIDGNSLAESGTGKRRNLFVSVCLIVKSEDIGFAGRESRQENSLRIPVVAHAVVENLTDGTGNK